MLSSKKGSARAAGKWIIVGGLFIQVIFFACFMLVTAMFFSRLRKTPTPRVKTSTIPWRVHAVALFTISTLIFVRSVFRVIEYLQGTDRYLLRHEIWLYIFDATLMAAVLLLYNIVHPSQITSILTGKRAVSHVVCLKVSTKVQEFDGQGNMKLESSM